MFDYLDKFNNLNSDLKNVVSSKSAVNLIDSLEKEYNVDLASLIMRIMIKELSVDSLPLILFTEFNLSQDKSEALAQRLKSELFSELSSYLNFSIEEIVDEKSNLITESEDKQDSHTKLVDNIQEGVAEDDKNQEEFSSLNEIESLEPEESSLLEESLSSAPEAEDLKNNYNKKLSFIALKVLEILKFKFEDKEIEKKFLSALDKYIRGIKDKFSSRDLFSKNIESGGFGLNDKMIDNIFMIIEEIKKKEHQIAKDNLKLEGDILGKIEKLSHGKIFSETDQVLLTPDDFSHKIAPLKPGLISHNMPMVIEQSDDLSNQEENQGSSLPEKLSTENQVLNNSNEEINEEMKEKIDSDFSEMLNEIQEEIILNPKPEIKNQSLSDDSGKIKMTDIKRVKITGPVDELKYMDLVNFRRLSEKPEEAFSRISQKLGVLEDIDYSKKLEGIKAWRQSPVNRLYLKIFSQASEEGITIEESIEKFKSSGKDYLKKEEIDALINFNKSLIF